MNMTVISSMKAIEVFGPNKSKVRLDKDGKYKSITQEWQGSKKNRVQIKVGQQEVPTECLEWAMIKAMIDAKIITVGAAIVVKKTAAEKKLEKDAKAAAKAEKLAATKLAEDNEELPPAKK